MLEHRTLHARHSYATPCAQSHKSAQCFLHAEQRVHAHFLGYKTVPASSATALLVTQRMKGHEKQNAYTFEHEISDTCVCKAP